MTEVSLLRVERDVTCQTVTLSDSCDNLTLEEFQSKRVEFVVV